MNTQELIKNVAEGKTPAEALSEKSIVEVATLDGVKRVLQDFLGAHGAEGPQSVLEILADEAREVANHLSTNWQDESTAREWDKFAGEIDRVAMKANRLPGGGQSYR